MMDTADKVLVTFTLLWVLPTLALALQAIRDLRASNRWLRTRAWNFEDNNGAEPQKGDA